MSFLLMLAGCASREPAVRYRYVGSLDDTSVYSRQNAYLNSAKDEPASPSAGLPALPPMKRPQPASSTGANSASSVGPLDAGPGVVTIQPDSVIQVRVEEDPSLDGSYPANEIGAIDLGYVGPVVLFNMTEAMAEKKVAEILEGRFFQTANVSVKIVRASYDKVSMMGAFTKPGTIKIGAGDSISLNDAIVRAGGIRPTAKGTTVKVIRNGQLSAIPLAMDGEEYSLVDKEGKPAVPDVFLRNNDVVYVSSSEPGATAESGEKEIYVFGEVTKPGTYRFTSGEPCTMMHLVLDKLGGLPAYAKKDAVKIIRRGTDGFEEEVIVNVEEILKDGNPDHDVPLESGDRVVVPVRRLFLF